MTAQPKAATVEIDISDDAYTEHLAVVNQEQSVSATDDICNAQGQIIVKEGARIDQQTAERITRFKLKKPIECSIALENELNPSLLGEKIKTFFHSDVSTALLYEKYNDPELLLKCSEHACQFALLRQKITVMSLIMPSVFEQALFCAWLGMTLVARNRYPDIKPENIFLAGLCHDVGMVHIRAEVLEKTERLTTEEWRQIQAHPVIGYNIVKETQGMDDIVSRAVLEHHENLDGSGYPRARDASELSVEGQILNLLDSMNAIFNKRFRLFNRSIKGLIPIIQIMRHSRFSDAGKQIVVLLKALPDDMTPANIPDAIAPKILDTIQARIDYITQSTHIAVKLAAELAKYKEAHKFTRHVKSIQSAIVHISVTLTQCGIINETYKSWLDAAFAEKDKNAFKEVEEAYLMMHELIFLVERLHRQIAVFVETKASAPEAKLLQAALKSLQEVKLPNIEPMLANMWLFKD